ncbi:dipeptidase [Vitiosangium sp. GDMCC 1.1324]|uniref:dipeptidase n=1 Tax=Vitiosangium sp. (strain GDMCC 1.1324) TaxID=2138576 RepID=UPI00130ECE21|nr:membrane dipeptidase [Vitiosangium sp. GDMCC 1.1324]
MSSDSSRSARPSRRDVLQGAAALLSTAALPALAAPTSNVADVYRRALVIDGLTNDSPQLKADEAIEAGMTAAIVDIQIYPRNFPNALQALAEWQPVFRRPGGKMLPVLRAEDLRRAKAERKLGIILACQDAQILDAAMYSVSDQNLDNLELFHAQGLRVLQLTHNDRNALGDSYREPGNAGLSVLGQHVVDRMNELGMLVDLSHCGDRTTAEAIERSKKPCAITHAGCRAVYATGRNKPDELLKALAGKGGVFGVFNMSVWLTDKPTVGLEDLLTHVDHAVKVAGVEHVGFGSDGYVVRTGEGDPQKEIAGFKRFVERNKGLPGSEQLPQHLHVAELNGPDRLLRLAEGLDRRGYKPADIEKILGGNFARLLRDTLG